MKQTLILAFLALCMGCAARQRIFEKPGGQQSEFAYCQYDCSIKARQLHPLPYNANLIDIVLNPTFVQNEFDACMHGYGWNLQGR